MLCCAVLCCAVLCCAVLCCAVLCCAVLCCAVLCCAVLCCVRWCGVAHQGGFGISKDYMSSTGEVKAELSVLEDKLVHIVPTQEKAGGFKVARRGGGLHSCRCAAVRRGIVLPCVLAPPPTCFRARCRLCCGSTCPRRTTGRRDWNGWFCCWVAKSIPTFWSASRTL
jgi:hypothetical protein